MYKYLQCNFNNYYNSKYILELVILTLFLKIVCLTLRKCNYLAIILVCQYLWSSFFTIHSLSKSSFSFVGCNHLGYLMLLFQKSKTRINQSNTPKIIIISTFYKPILPKNMSVLVPAAWGTPLSVLRWP